MIDTEIQGLELECMKLRLKSLQVAYDADVEMYKSRWESEKAYIEAMQAQRDNHRVLAKDHDEYMEILRENREMSKRNTEAVEKMEQLLSTILATLNTPPRPVVTLKSLEGGL